MSGGSLANVRFTKAMFDKKWVKPLAMALSLPSTIIFAAVFCKILVEEEVLSWTFASIIFVAIVGSTIYLMVYYAYKKKKG